MPVFVDYEYPGVPPVAGGWGAIVLGGLQRVNPPNLAVPPAPLPLPRLQDVVDSGVSVVQVWRSAQATGHGKMTEMAVRWLLKGVPLTVSELVDLNVWSFARVLPLQAIFSATKAGANFTHLAPKAIHELLDPSEKTAQSYYLGSALAGICGPAAVKQRTGAIIRRLFHVSLLDAHTHLFDSVRVLPVVGESKPDFLGFDENCGIHVFEAKGSSVKCDYEAIAKGLKQILNVAGIAFTHPLPQVVFPPVSLNVCWTFHSNNVVQQFPFPPGAVNSGLRVGIFHLPGAAPTPENAALLSPLPGPLYKELTGLHALGLWLSLQASEPVPGREQVTGSKFRLFRQPSLFMTFALPRALYDSWGNIINGLLHDVAPARIEVALAQAVVELGEKTLLADHHEHKAPDQRDWTQSLNEPWLWLIEDAAALWDSPNS